MGTMLDQPVEPPKDDPRVYFSAERTLLAWIRTGIGVMAFGFVAARFGLFVRMLSPEAAPGAGAATPIGIALVLLGVLSTAAGAIQYRRFCRTLRPTELPSRHATTLPLLLAWLLVGTGAVLALVLLR